MEVKKEFTVVVGLEGSRLDLGIFGCGSLLLRGLVVL